MSSDLSFIDVINFANPAILFHEWIDEANMHGVGLLIMNLATAAKNGDVSTRNMVVTEVTTDAALAFQTQKNSTKVKHIAENPKVCASILLSYIHNQTRINRQICLSGKAVELPREKCEIYYEKLQLSAKIRSWIAKDCKPVEWNEFKKKHDNLLEEVNKGKELKMPDNLVAFQIVPDKIDFYYSEGNKIGDRVLFTKQDNLWKFERIMP